MKFHTVCYVRDRKIGRWREDISNDGGSGGCCCLSEHRSKRERDAQKRRETERSAKKKGSIANPAIWRTTVPRNTRVTRTRRQRRKKVPKVWLDMHRGYGASQRRRSETRRRRRNVIHRDRILGGLLGARTWAIVRLAVAMVTGIGTGWRRSARDQSLGGRCLLAEVPGRPKPEGRFILYGTWKRSPRKPNSSSPSLD